MPPNCPDDAEVDGWLKALNIASLCQWDVLVFLHEHQTSLVGVDLLARLLGYPDEQVVVASDTLESLHFVNRSRLSQGARLYQFTGLSSPPHDEAFKRLLALADNRPGRLLLSRRLPRIHGGREQMLAAGGKVLKSGQLARLARESVGQRTTGRKSWRKAI